MPNIIADSLYLCWDEFLKGKLKQEAKKHSNTMIKCYRMFNREFFNCFNEEQTGVCCDVMNYFYDFTENELKLFRMSVRNKLKQVDREHREVISHIAVCKFLASQANEIWSIVYRGPYGEKLRNNNLHGMYVASRELLNAYTKRNVPAHLQGIDLADDADIKSSMKRFEARVMAFIREWK